MHRSRITVFLALGLLALGLVACATPGPRDPVELRFPQVTPPELDLLEARLHERVNAVRAEHGLAPLAWDPALLQLAREYSVTTREADRLEHNIGRPLGARYERAGYSCRLQVGNSNTYLVGGENLALTAQIPSIALYSDGTEEPQSIRSFDELVEVTVQGWMNSPPHRENLLNPTWQREGIGVVIDADHRLWITQNFC